LGGRPEKGVTNGCDQNSTVRRWKEKKMKRFIFKKLRGTFCHGMVSWGGAHFQIEAASQELRAAIESGKA
jgi:hypothetical protein